MRSMASVTSWCTDKLTAPRYSRRGHRCRSARRSACDERISGQCSRRSAVQPRPSSASEYPVRRVPSSVSDSRAVIFANSLTAGCRPCTTFETTKPEKQRREPAKHAAIAVTASRGTSTSVERCNSSRREKRAKSLVRTGALHAQSCGPRCRTRRSRPLTATASRHPREAQAAAQVSRGDMCSITFASVSEWIPGDEGSGCGLGSAPARSPRRGRVAGPGPTSSHARQRPPAAPGGDWCARDPSAATWRSSSDACDDRVPPIARPSGRTPRTCISPSMAPAPRLRRSRRWRRTVRAWSHKRRAAAGAASGPENL